MTSVFLQSSVVVQREIWVGKNKHADLMCELINYVFTSVVLLIFVLLTNNDELTLKISVIVASILSVDRATSKTNRMGVKTGYFSHCNTIVYMIFVYL